jgi:hypothetical protein
MGHVINKKYVQNFGPETPGKEYIYPDSQEIPSLLWNPKIRHSAHNSPQLVAALSQINPIHILSPIFKSHINIILPFAPGPSRCKVG